MEATQINEVALRAAAQGLADLVELEYGQTLAELLDRDDAVVGDEYEAVGVRDSQDAFWRIGRLVGITVKEPFATPRDREEWEPSQTGARRVWELDAETQWASRSGLWQYELLAEFLQDAQRAGDYTFLANDPEAEQIGHFLRDAQSERGLFNALAARARPYICRNPQVREELAKQGVLDADPRQMGASVVTTGAAAAIIDAVPWLGPAALPVVAGILLLIAAHGLDGFCSRTLPAVEFQVVET